MGAESNVRLAVDPAPFVLQCPPLTIRSVEEAVRLQAIDSSHSFGIPIYWLTCPNGNVAEKDRLGESGCVVEIRHCRLTAFASSYPFLVMTRRTRQRRCRRLEVGELFLGKQLISTAAVIG